MAAAKRAGVSPVAVLLLSLVGASTWGEACVVPERKYDAQLAEEIARLNPSSAPPAAPDAGNGGGQQPNEPSPLCDEYCAAVMGTCVAGAAVYASEDECLATCRRLPPGEPGALDGNSVQCRLSELRRTSFEPIDCADVGPISLDGTCGEPCQTFCDLQRLTCGDAEEAYCTSVCRAVLPRGDTYRIDRFSNTDTLQCRVKNLVRAAESGGEPLSCREVRIAPPGQEFSCQDGRDFPRGEDREYYCTLMDFSCQGEDAVYDSHEQCLAVSALFEPGAPDAFGDNTLRCRRLHAYFSLRAEEKSMHCRHAGPTGDSGCGSNCESYCSILAQGCPDAFESTFGTSGGVDRHSACVADCEAEDSGLPDARGTNVFGTVAPFYSVNGEPPPGTLKCRALNAVRALAAPNDEQLCTAAVGAADSPCAPLN